MGLQEKQPLLISKVIIFSAAFFIVILLSGSIAFMFAMSEIVSENKGRELSQITEIERLKLEGYVNKEISIVLMAVDSPLIQRYFADPGDRELEKIALEEISAYRRAFTVESIFWISDADKMFYFNDEPPYLLDPESPDNYWYNMTLYETEIYNFNINYNPDLNVTNLWINAPVSDENGKPLGILGTGIELSMFLDMIYKNYEGRADFYFVNASGEITGAEDEELVAVKRNIEEVLGENIVERTRELKSGGTAVFNSGTGKIAVGALPLLEWYSVALLPDSIDDYKNSMSILFIVMIIVMALVFIVFDLFIASLLIPLRESIIKAEAANLAKSNFLSTMSHEMRTPMNAIIGMTTVGRNSGDNTRKDYAFDKIEHASTHLLGIINDVLDMSKMETNKFELSLEEFDFEKMIQRIITIINFKIEEKKQEFSLKIDAHTPKSLIGDDQRLAQVILNLLSNAVKFTPEHGRISLEVYLLGEAAGVCKLRVEVADNGLGISAEQQGKLFDMFVQVESGTNREYGGTGLGLAISKRIVELMGGAIWVESELGKGARFIFTVLLTCVKTCVKKDPAKDVPLNEEEKRLTTVSGQIAVFGNKGEFAGKRLLIAEDIDINREIIVSLLENTGIAMEIAENGKEALDMIALDPDKYDIVFMDVQMPKMDGLEATRRIRALPAPQGKRLPIVAMTANVFDSDIEECLAAGMDGHLGKPLDIDMIMKIMRKYL